VPAGMALRPSQVATEGLLLDRLTVTPFEGAGPLSVTVAVEFAVPPPITRRRKGKYYLTHSLEAT
jgi:hypothetical protein